MIAAQDRCQPPTENNSRRRSPEADSLLRADRAYQSAANFMPAILRTEERFATIAEDQPSPWRVMAGLVARSRREAPGLVRGEKKNESLTSPAQLRNYRRSWFRANHPVPKATCSLGCGCTGRASA
jgi:hypothetical protein